MFNLRSESPPSVSIYKTVQSMFTTQENLEYLSHYTGVEPDPRNYKKFLEQYMSKISMRLSPRDNLMNLNKYVLGLASTDGPKTPTTHIIELFSSGPNIDYLNKVFGRDMLKDVVDFKRQAREFIEGSGGKNCNIEALNKHFIELRSHSYYNDEDSYLETAFKNTLLFPKGYESFNSGGLRRVDTGCDYYEPRPHEINYSEEYYDYASAECSGRKQRYDKIPYWQKTSTYARTMEGQGFDEHLGASTREFISRKSKQKTFKK